VRNLRTFGMRAAGVGILALAAVALWAAAASGTPAKSRGAAAKPVNASLVSQLALARVATAKYVNNLGLAKRDGYGIITRMIPNMGWHFMNPKIAGFNVRRPQILVYERRGSSWQLGALEWVFTSKPAKGPLPGAKYGTFGAGCHFKDGTFVPAESQSACPKSSPQTGSAFNFWHPLLYTLHVWLWFPNPSGLYASTNPYAAAFNKG
jgi:hypothetical protein